MIWIIFDYVVWYFVTAPHRMCSHGKCMNPSDPSGTGRSANGGISIGMRVAESLNR